MTRASGLSRASSLPGAGTILAIRADRLLAGESLDGPGVAVRCWRRQSRREMYEHLRNPPWHLDDPHFRSTKFRPARRLLGPSSDRASMRELHGFRTGRTTPYGSRSPPPEPSRRSSSDLILGLGRLGDARPAAGLGPLVGPDPGRRTVQPHARPADRLARRIGRPEGPGRHGPSRDQGCPATGRRDLGDQGRGPLDRSPRGRPHRQGPAGHRRVQGEVSHGAGLHLHVLQARAGRRQALHAPTS